VGSLHLHMLTVNVSELTRVQSGGIPDLERSRGLVQVATRIVDALDAAAAIETQIRFRLYGAWFNGGIFQNVPSSLSQKSSLIFPRVIVASAGSRHVSRTLR
jgi:hypothetical protein